MLKVVRSLSFGKYKCSWEISKAKAHFCGVFFNLMYCYIWCHFFVLISPSLVTTVSTQALHTPDRTCTRQFVWNTGLWLTNTPVFLLYFQVKYGTLPSFHLCHRCIRKIYILGPKCFTNTFTSLARLLLFVTVVDGIPIWNNPHSNPSQWLGVIENICFLRNPQFIS